MMPMLSKRAEASVSAHPLPPPLIWISLGLEGGPVTVAVPRGVGDGALEIGRTNEPRVCDSGVVAPKPRWTPTSVLLDKPR